MQAYFRQQSLLKPNNKGVRNDYLHHQVERNRNMDKKMLKTSVCKYVVRNNNLQKSRLEWRFEHDSGSDNLQKNNVWNNNFKNVVQDDDNFTEIFVKKTDAEIAVFTWSSSKYGSISMAKYWHAVWLNIALHFLFVGKFKKAGAIKGQVIMEQLFAASYRLLTAAAVQYSFIKSKYF